MVLKFIIFQKKSGWVLKKGSGQLEVHQDFTMDFSMRIMSLSKKKNKLDQCNGGNLNGRYTYFVTDEYPFIPRCLFGIISPDFNRSRHR